MHAKNMATLKSVTECKYDLFYLLLFLLICVLTPYVVSPQGNTPGYQKWVSVVSSLSAAVDMGEIVLFIILTFGGLFGKGVTT